MKDASGQPDALRVSHLDALASAKSLVRRLLGRGTIHLRRDWSGRVRAGLAAALPLFQDHARI